MIDLSEFESIRPYSDEEAVEAYQRVARHPMLPVISKYLFPKQAFNTLQKALCSVHSIEEFQKVVMVDVVNSVLAKTSEGFTCSGVENLNSLKDKRFLAISNHRDIVLDPCLICYSMFDQGVSDVGLCVGSNLLQSGLVEDLLRSNRMIKVIRGISARELYLSSKTLSKYIRLSITSGTSSVWVAQREGRTKDGWDTTEQGLLKMFDMSGENGFEENFKELNIIPLTISYEYEPCDARKARELYIKQIEGKYVKKPKEDMHSILTGIGQKKGHIHLTIGKPLTSDEIAQAASLSGNERYQCIRHMLDKRIIEGYKLWKTNYMAYDLLNNTSDFQGDKYLPTDLIDFKKYIDYKMSKIEARYDRSAVKEIFLRIYANPVIAVLQKEG